MNLTHLRVFRAVLESNSITAAARTLRISQPAASKQLAELEASIGVPLLERRARGVRLTAAGELLGRHARRLFQEEAAAEAALKGLLGLELGQLAVGASTTVGNYIIPALFGQLHTAHPQLELELEIANTTRIQELLLEGRLDLGLIEGLVGNKGLQVEVFTRDEMVLIVAPGHPLSLRAEAARGITKADLEDVAIIARERGSGTREVVEEALSEHGIELRPCMSLGSTEAVKSAVARGIGAAIVSRLTLELELKSGTLRTIDLPGLRILRELRLVTLEGKALSPIALEFLRLLRERYSVA
jgi:DNA-binding transcriptional LysR family regulator